MAIIEIQKLTKHYGKTKAVDNLTFSVDKGEVFGFLGPNGAGKTTTIRCLMDFIRPTSGKLTILGFDSKTDAAEIKKHVGYLSPEVPLYDNWTGDKHIDFVAHLSGRPVKNKAYLIDKLNFNPKQKVKSLSSGNRQKLGLILALATEPEVIVLDEPTAALDPLLQNTVYDLLKEFSQKGSTIFLSSHNLPEVERVCSRVAVVRSGKLVAVEDIDKLRQQQLRIVRVRLKEPVKADQFDLPGVDIVEINKNTATLKVKSDVNPLLKQLARFEVEDINISHASLEEVFLSFYHNETKS